MKHLIITLAVITHSLGFSSDVEYVVYGATEPVLPGTVVQNAKGLGINRLGQFVGSFEKRTPNGPTEFIWVERGFCTNPLPTRDAGGNQLFNTVQVAPIGSQSDDWSRVSDINDSGFTVGTSSVKSIGKVYGFSWQDGQSVPTSIFTSSPAEGWRVAQNSNSFGREWNTNSETYDPVPRINGTNGLFALMVSWVTDGVNSSPTYWSDFEPVGISDDGLNFLVNMSTMPGIAFPEYVKRNTGWVYKNSTGGEFTDLFQPAYIAANFLNQAIIEGKALSPNFNFAPDTGALAGEIVGWYGPEAIASRNIFRYFPVTNSVTKLTGTATAGHEPEDVNVSGVVCGTGNRKAFVLTSANSMYYLNDKLASGYSGWNLKSAQSLNDNGQIVGLGRLNNADRAYIASPVYSQARTLSATVSREGWVGSTPTSADGTLTYELRYGKVLISSGSLSWPTNATSVTMNFSSSLRGKVNLSIKASKWLRRTKEVVVPFEDGSVDISAGTFSLSAGDADNDNYIGTDDYTILNAAFDTSIGDPGWDARADFNGDGTISTDDYLLLNNNFDRDGDD